MRDTIALVVVARERSFARAVAQLGVSQSALSHVFRGLEARMAYGYLRALPGLTDYDTACPKESSFSILANACVAGASITFDAIRTLRSF
jgi:hypothetical protein